MQYGIGYCLHKCTPYKWTLIKVIGLGLSKKLLASPLMDIDLEWMDRRKGNCLYIYEMNNFLCNTYILDEGNDA
jgi:hypothetical protein